MGQTADATSANDGGSSSERSRGRIFRGVVCAALGGICWGFSGTCAQFLTGDAAVPVSWITCVRLLSAAFIFLVVCMVREPRNLFAALRDARSIGRIAAFALLGVLLTQVSYLTAISYTNAGTGTVLERLGLILIMLYVCLRTRRLPRISEAVGLVLAIAGTVVIATKGDLGSLAIPAEGLFWGFISAFALAFYTLLPGKVLEKWGSFIVTGLAMLIGGVVATVFVQPWTIPVTVSPMMIGVMTAMVIVGTFAAYLFYLQGITDAGPVRAGLVGCVEPVSATVISAVWLGTPVGMFDIVGCIMIIAMVFLVTDRGSGNGKGAAAYDGASEDLPLFQGRASELGYYAARQATRDDFRRVQLLQEETHRAIARLGVDEGLKKYPSSRRIMRSIDAGKTYVVVTAGEASDGDSEKPAERVLGMFAVNPAGDPAYGRATGARWLTDSPEPPDGEPDYAALHWVCVQEKARRCGVGAYILGTAERIARDAGRRSVRADVYPENQPMRALLEKCGYVFCGDIEIRDRLGRVKRRVVYEKCW